MEFILYIWFVFHIKLLSWFKKSRSICFFQNIGDIILYFWFFFFSKPQCSTYRQIRPEQPPPRNSPPLIKREFWNIQIGHLEQPPLKNKISYHPSNLRLWNPTDLQWESRCDLNKFQIWWGRLFRMNW